VSFSSSADNRISGNTIKAGKRIGRSIYIGIYSCAIRDGRCSTAIYLVPVVAVTGGGYLTSFLQGRLDQVSAGLKEKGRTIYLFLFFFFARFLLTFFFQHYMNLPHRVIWRPAVHYPKGGSDVTLLVSDPSLIRVIVNRFLTMGDKSCISEDDFLSPFTGGVDRTGKGSAKRIKEARNKRHRGIRIIKGLYQAIVGIIPLDMADVTHILPAGKQRGKDD